MLFAHARLITPMLDSGALPKMHVRRNATKLRGVQKASERLIGFLEWDEVGTQVLPGFSRRAFRA